MSNPYAQTHALKGYRLAPGKGRAVVLCWCGWESEAGTIHKGKASLSEHIEAVRR